MGLLQLNIGTSAYAQMLRVVSRFHEAIYSDPESPTGLNQNLDFRSVILEHDEQLNQYFEEWMGRFQRDSDLNSTLRRCSESWRIHLLTPVCLDPILKFRAGLLPL